MSANVSKVPWPSSKANPCAHLPFLQTHAFTCLTLLAAFQPRQSCDKHGIPSKSRARGFCSTLMGHQREFLSQLVTLMIKGKIFTA